MSITQTTTQATLNKTKAFAYMRVSGLGQEDGDGFTRQREAIERYAAACGMEIVRWFQDTHTGKDEWSKRPGWTEMIGAVNGVSTIVTERMDRVARSMLVQEMIVDDLQKRGISLRTTTGDDSSDEDPERVMFRQILGVFAQYERTVIVAKMRAARVRIRARDGKCEGRKAFGVKEGEADSLRMMKQLRAGELMTFERVAAKMNELGLPTRGGGKWIGAAVCKILRREGGDIGSMGYAIIALT